MRISISRKDLYRLIKAFEHFNENFKPYFQITGNWKYITSDIIIKATDLITNIICELTLLL